MFGVFTQFSENAGRRPGMKEGNVEALGALARGFVNQLHALGVHLLQGAHGIIHGISDVVDALAFLLYEFGDRSFRVRGFQQFDLCLADHEEGGPYFLVRNFFDVVTGESEDSFPEFPGFFNAFNSNADVFNMVNFHVRKF